MRPKFSRKGLAAGIAAIGGFARNFGVAVADVQDLDKLIVRTCKGQTNHGEKQKAMLLNKFSVLMIYYRFLSTLEKVI